MAYRAEGRPGTIASAAASSGGKRRPVLPESSKPVSADDF
jgi:hypothetical protein